MYIRRDYTRSYYDKRRHSSPLMILILGMMIGGILVITSLQFSTLQAEALKMVGMAPAPTAFPGVYANSGAEKFAKGDLKGAKQDLGQAAALAPDNIPYLYEYGRVLIELDEAELAVPVADRIIEIAPNDVRGYALKANALAWSDSGNAVPIAIQGRNIDPNFGAIYVALTLAYTNLSRYELARDSAERGMQLEPNNPEIYRAYAYTMIYLGNSPRAVELLETAIALNPNLTAPYFQLAYEYKSPRMNQPKMAAAIYEHLINISVSVEDKAKANLRMCETFNAADKVDFALAEPYCREAINIKPDYGSAYRELGRMRYKRRNYEGAIEAFQTCVALGATDIECWGLRGLAHYWMGQCDLAWEVLNEAAIRARQQGEGQGTIDDIDTGLYNVTQKCDGYRNIPTPTAVLPTAIPPTPIGGL